VHTQCPLSINGNGNPAESASNSLKAQHIISSFPYHIIWKGQDFVNIHSTGDADHQLSHNGGHAWLGQRYT
jgi:hypothetical protein